MGLLWRQIESYKLAVETYLDAELAKYNSYKQFCSGEFSRTKLGIENGHAFSKLKDRGVGRLWRRIE